MKNHFFYSLLIICAIPGIFISCTKFLDEKSSNTITTPNTLQDLQALLDDALVMNLSGTPAMGEASASDYYLRDGRFEKQYHWQQTMYKWAPDAYNYPNDWSRNYSPVFNANYCLEMVQKTPQNEGNRTSWNNVFGSALFYRAYYFLMLSWNYAKAYDKETADKDLGIVLRLGSDFNASSQRSTIKECYFQIIADAQESINYLPPLPLHAYRPSKCAAYGLLARTYLSMREYDSAYKYANLSLTIKSDLMNYNSDNDILGLTRNAPFKKFNKETIFYTEMNSGEAGLLIYPGYIAVDSSLLLQFDSSDLRTQGYFLKNSGYLTFKGSYAQANTFFTGIATDEILLTRAEAAARTNNQSIGVDNAVKDLNTLLKTRYKNNMAPVIQSIGQDSTVNLILKERRKELMFRGLRWMDIKRLNKEGRMISLKRSVGGAVYSLSPNSNYFALPLPTDIINITGIQQN